MRRVSITSGCRTSCAWRRALADTLKLLEQRGQKVAVKEAMGSTQSIMVGPDGALFGASDPRSVDDLTAGY